MIFRVLIAAVGAIVVTGGLLLAMDTATSLFENESGERYFRISDFLPRPEPGRPERPGASAPQPELAEPELAGPETALPIEVPAIPESESPELLEPDIVLPQPLDN